MARGRPAASVTPGPPASKTKDPKAMATALYEWCQSNFQEGHVLFQDDLLRSGLIPGNDTNVLIAVTQHLINECLFTSQQFPSGGYGWKLIPQVSAEKFKSLSSDEGLVYRVIESTGRAGAWLKTIKTKLNLHQKNVDSSIKTLLQRGYIKSMATVKYPNRKMYILAGLQPNEDATGGAWFTDGALDHELLEEISSVLEWRISALSWKLVKDPKSDVAPSQSSVHRKRKEPQGGFSSTRKGKEKMQRTDAEAIIDGSAAQNRDEGNQQGNSVAEMQQVEANVPKKAYVPHPAGHRGYPSLQDLTAFVNESNMMQTGKLSENDISQLLDVMAYDDRIIKITSSDEVAPTMYKARKTIAQLADDRTLENRVREAKLNPAQDKQTLRELEINKIGSGGITEIPCGRCPVFDMCEEGGPINANNCEYFDAWFTQLERARAAEGELVW